jgi:lantibiotic biosynthesis protein
MRGVAPRHSGFFVLRTPLLPVSVVTGLSAGLEASAAQDAAGRADALMRDRARVRGRLRELVATPIVREAIAVASPDLERSIDVWLSAPDTDRGQGIERGLLRYLVRMASRPTPFGLFAGNATGTIGAPARLAVDPPTACRRLTRLDMDYLAQLAESLARDPALAAAQPYAPNSSLHRSGDRWHYVESLPVKDGRSHHLVAIDDSDALRESLDRARHGATRGALAEALVDRHVTTDEARAYVDELIASQILVPALDCPVTGDDSLGGLIATLRGFGGDAAADRLAAAAAALDAIDAAPLGGAVDRYDEIARGLEPLGVPITAARLFQVDLVKPGGASTLDAAILGEIVRGIDVLHRLAPKPLDDPLARLRAAFAERYQQLEVPLFEVLDEESGIASALGDGQDRATSPLLDGIGFSDPRKEVVAWTSRERGLLRRVGDVLAAGGGELELTDDDLDELGAGPPPPLPPAFAVMATLIGTPEGVAATRPDCRVLLRSVAGPSGAALLGRFCHADPHLLEVVRSHLRAEEATDPDAVFAEIVHLPEGRIGNILARPVLREYEIVYLGRSGAPIERQLPLDDLRLSLEGDRFVLRSARLGRRVVPRLTSAHNYLGRSIAVYRFLCLLQSDRYAGSVMWSWGPLGALPYLPRVVSGRLVLARARWLVGADEIDTLRAATGAARYDAVQQWRRTRRLPRWIVLADDDNTLVVDLENIVAIDSFVQMLNDRKAATLLEWYPGPDDLCAEGADGRFAHELVIPFTRDGLTASAEAPGDGPQERAAVPATTRHALPGSPWIYAQLYSGHAAADRLIAAGLGPIGRALVAKGAADRWFFVRYFEPSPHLRWRLHATSRRAQTAIRQAVEKAAADLHARGLVHRLVFDTYEREIERYGGLDALEQAETLFWIDSEAVVDVLDTLANASAAGDARWQSALLGVDSLLADLGLEVAARLTVVARAREQWGKRLHVNADVRRDLARKFRSLEGDLAKVIERQFDSHAVLGEIASVFSDRSRRYQPVIAGLMALAEGGRLAVPIETLADSYVHMHLNRVFRAEPNLHEVVIYDFLVQLYTRRLARARHAAPA